MNDNQQSILKSYPIPGDYATAPGRVTLRVWHSGEWVTHFYNLQDGGFYYGRYFTDLAEAEANFECRVKEYLGLEKLPNSPESNEPVNIPEHILQGIDAVRDGNTINMFDANMVRLQAVALGYVETALWIETNTKTYYDGMFRGFVPIST